MSNISAASDFRRQLGISTSTPIDAVADFVDHRHGRSGIGYVNFDVGVQMRRRATNLGQTRLPPGAARKATTGSAKRTRWSRTLCYAAVKQGRSARPSFRKPLLPSFARQMPSRLGPLLVFWLPRVAPARLPRRGRRAPARPGTGFSSHLEVLRLRVVENECVRGLLGVQHQLITEDHAHPFGLQQLCHLAAVLHVRARGVSE